jgi:hypothetical protein
MIPPVERCASVVALLVFFILSAAAQQPAPELRVWTATNGQKFQAKLVGVDGASGVFQLANGQTTKVALQYLSAPDQLLIRKNTAPNAAPPNPPVAGSTGATKPSTIPKQRTWPAIVEVPSSSIEITIAEQDPAKRRYVYKSQAFEFVSQDKLAGSVMKEVARTFEATRALVSALPWGIEPTPPKDLGFYQARLYVTREDYFADGGPVNSGGVYFSNDRIFRIPFPSLGLQMQGKTWFKKPDYRGDTLVHEVTHQMMHDFLPFLPKWVIEGTAEYTESLPYNAGRFLAGSHSRGVKEYIRKSTEHRVLTSGFRPFGEHMTMGRNGWDSLSTNSNSQHLLYYQSYLLVYFFSHLDGDGKGTRFLKYLDSIAEARTAWEEFFKKPEVKNNGDGSFSWPSNISLPAAKRSEEYGIEKLSILMDGRDAATLETDIKNGFKKIGIKL